MSFYAVNKYEFFDISGDARLIEPDLAKLIRDTCVESGKSLLRAPKESERKRPF